VRWARNASSLSVSPEKMGTFAKARPNLYKESVTAEAESKKINDPERSCSALNLARARRDSSPLPDA
jgi:hypothetical protein